MSIEVNPSIMLQSGMALVGAIAVTDAAREVVNAFRDTDRKQNAIVRCLVSLIIVIIIIFLALRFAKCPGGAEQSLPDDVDDAELVDAAIDVDIDDAKETMKGGKRRTAGAKKRAVTGAMGAATHVRTLAQTAQGFLNPSDGGSLQERTISSTRVASTGLDSRYGEALYGSTYYELFGGSPSSGTPHDGGMMQ
jgi:hypothetical protein